MRDPRDAFDAHAHAHAGAVFDVGLPDGDGLDLLYWVRRAGKRCSGRFGATQEIVMPNYINSCPGCASTQRDIGDFAAYFEVYACEKCDHRFCFKCSGSNGGKECPECGSDDFSTFGRVSKP